MFDRADPHPEKRLVAREDPPSCVCLDEALLVSEICSSLFVIEVQSGRRLDAIALASGNETVAAFETESSS